MHASAIVSVMSTEMLPWELLEAVERAGKSAPQAQRLAAATARVLVEGGFSSGEILTEVSLAESAGVSRTPAREAMLQLADWGLVKLIPKKGAVVTTANLKEKRDLLRVRAMFESDAVSAFRFSSVGLRDLAVELDTCLERQRQALKDQDLLGFASADFALHAAIIAAGENQVVLGVLEKLAPRLAQLTYLSCQERPDTLHVLLAEHEALAAHARSGAAREFSVAVQEHIQQHYFPQGDQS